MNESVRCHYCGQPLEVVQVHGHGQCRRCGINIDPCCGGECATPAEGRGGSAEPSPDLIR